jgi:DNA sulfur modification protein DndB
METSQLAQFALFGNREAYSAPWKVSGLADLQDDFADLSRRRVSSFAKYVLSNSENYFFPPVVISFRGDARFHTRDEEGQYGVLAIKDPQFTILDGRHRCAALLKAAESNPRIRRHTIMVLLVPFRDDADCQMLSADLNRAISSRLPPRLTNAREDLLALSTEVCTRVESFVGIVDTSSTPKPAHSSPYLFTLRALCDANQELLRHYWRAKPDFQSSIAVEYWTELSKLIVGWRSVKDGEIEPLKFKQENVSSHAVVLRSLGAVGNLLFQTDPDGGWKARLAPLAKVDWSRDNPEWIDVCIVANSIASNRQARLATLAFFKLKVGLPLTDAERKSLPNGQQPNDHSAGMRESPTSTESKES